MPDQSEPILDAEDLARLHVTYEAMACGVVTTDAAGKIIAANSAAQRIFGLTLSELRGHTLPQVHRGAVRLDGSPIPLEDRPAAVVARTGQALRDRVLGITRRDGQRRWLQVETVPVIDHGDVLCVVSSVTDITDYIQAEEAQRASEERFRLLSEHASDLVRVVQGDGTILYASPSHQRILGYAPDDLVGRTSFDYVHPDDLPRVLAEFNAAIERGDATITSTYRVRHADGSWRVIEVTATDHQADPVLRGLVINARDITERVAAEEALRRSEARFRTLIEQAPLGIGVVDEQGCFETVNDAYCALFGYTCDELIGRHTALLFPASSRASGVTGHTGRRPTGGRRGIEVDALAKDGTPVTVLVTTVPLSGSDRRRKLASFVVDITARKRVERRLDHLAHHDPLTGLPNRALFRERLTQTIINARRRGQLAAVLFFDLDGFKAVNDHLGHDAGDALLRATAQRLCGCVREEDMVARLGGDEFTVLLPNIGSGDNAASVAHHLRQTLAQPFAVSGEIVSITASIGISIFPFDGGTSETLLNAADRAMYRAKGLGKDNIAFCESLA